MGYYIYPKNDSEWLGFNLFYWVKIIDYCYIYYYYFYYTVDWFIGCCEWLFRGLERFYLHKSQLVTYLSDYKEESWEELYSESSLLQNLKILLITDF